MKFSMSLIAFVAATASALPSNGDSNWGNVANGLKPATTTTTTPPPPAHKPTPTTTTPAANWKPMTTTSAGWSNNNKAAVVKAASSPSPSPNPAFSAAAAEASSKLGAPPSDTCNWQFILTCANQAYEAGSTCMTPMAKSSINCFSDTSCAAAIGDNASSCATCFSTVGKQQFINACYKESSQSAVAPVFKAMVSYGVCDSEGVAKNK